MTRGLLTVDDVRRREREQYHPADRARATILDPAAGECAPLFTSAKFSDCLTHLTRWIAAHPAWDHKTTHRTYHHDAYEYATGWCGVMMTARQIPLADATGFCCERCIDRAAQFGIPTFGLIPDTGCAVSGGRRGLRSVKR